MFTWRKILYRESTNFLCDFRNSWNKNQTWRNNYCKSKVIFSIFTIFIFMENDDPKWTVLARSFPNHSEISCRCWQHRAVNVAPPEKLTQNLISAHYRSLLQRLSKDILQGIFLKGYFCLSTKGSTFGNDL